MSGPTSGEVPDQWPDRPGPVVPAAPTAPTAAPTAAPPTAAEPEADASPETARPRTGRRDRHGRGRRGPDHRAGLPDPGGRGSLAPRGVPAVRTRRQRFDQVALDVLDDLEARLGDRLPPVDVAVEDVPAVPAGWRGDHALLGSAVPGTRTTRARVVLYRRPIEHRVQGLAELTALVLLVVVDQVAELIGADPASLHPDYPQD